MKYKMLMIAPGHGHNIEPWLEHLNKQDVFEVDFVCGKYNFGKNQFGRINVIEVEPSKKGLLSHFGIALKTRYQCLYIHGDPNYVAVIYLLFSRVKIKIFRESSVYTNP